MKKELKKNEVQIEGANMNKPIVINKEGEDSISRRAALDLAISITTDDYNGNEILEVVKVDDIKILPSVMSSCQDQQNDTLSKIRKEIDCHRRKTEGLDPYDLVGDCLDIIDKYTTGNEGEE